MTLKELSLFYHLCETTHLSNLSKELGMSQSAISLAMQSLEKKLGENLFDRIGKRLILNEKGRRFYEQTYTHYQALMEAQLFFKHNALAGVIKIACSKTIGEYLIPPRLYAFRARYPNVTIHSQILNSTHIIERVKRGEIDIGFIEASCDLPEIYKEMIAEDELIVVSSDPTLGDKEYYIDELFDRRWILRERGSGTREVFLEALGESAKGLPLFLEYHEFEEAKTLLRHFKECITALSRMVVETELRRKELFEIKITHFTFTRPLYLIYHKDKYQSQLFSHFKKSMMGLL